jgi:hypothetical protein
MAFKKLDRGYFMTACWVWTDAIETSQRELIRFRFIFYDGHKMRSCVCDLEEQVAHEALKESQHNQHSRLDSIRDADLVRVNVYLKLLLGFEGIATSLAFK